jgi:hypothetical protein
MVVVTTLSSWVPSKYKRRNIMMKRNAILPARERFLDVLSQLALLINTMQEAKKGLKDSVDGLQMTGPEKDKLEEFCCQALEQIREVEAILVEITLED